MNWSDFMPIKKSFFKTVEFKLFLTAFIVYVFYLQMYGGSCMANSNSALTAAIVNEGRLEVDTYYRASCDLAYYNGHYYSGLAPGISFIAAPLYAAGQFALEPLPESVIDYAYEKIDGYGKNLPKDFYGNEKRISYYFPALAKKDAVQHLIISTFILPTLTTALFSAISVALLYLILQYFTNDNKKKIIIALLYGFGTLLFPLSTEFFQRELAIAFSLASFLILLKIKHKEIDAKKSVFGAGLLAGFSIWFDYYHAVLLGLFGLYLIYILNKGSKKIMSIFEFKKIGLLLKFGIGALIPLILLMGYHYIAFDNPFTTPYKYRTTVDYEINLGKIPFPSTATIIRIFEFFIYSPIVIFGIYGLFIALRKKDANYPEAWGTLIFFILTFIYATSLAILYQSFMPSSHKRYMLPAVPYLMIFLSYALNGIKSKNQGKVTKVIMAVGLVSFLFNWSAAQLEGHASLTQFDLTSEKFIGVADMIRSGPSSSFARTLAGALGFGFIETLLINALALSLLAFLIWLIWRNTNNRIKALKTKKYFKK